MSKNFSIENWKKTHLPSLLKENDNPYDNPIIASVRAEGEYTDITPDTQVEVGDNVVSLKGYFGEITKIAGDKYKIVDSDGDSKVINRKSLESFYLIKK